MTIKHRVNPAVQYMCGLADKISQGAGLGETLNYIYDAFRDIIPYDRIGYAEVDEYCTTATSRWARSEGSTHLGTGYSAKLAKSSLSLVITHRKCRILNDLPAYLKNHPNSTSTTLIVDEGIRSSLTCPLFAGGIPTGFLFLSSQKPDCYSDEHARLLREVAGQISVSLLASELLELCDDDVDKAKKSSVGIGPSVLLRRIRRVPWQERYVEEEYVAAPHRAHEVGPVGNYASVSLPISSLTPNMVVAKSIRRSDGMLLLSAGSQLTDKWIARLTTMYDSGEIQDWRIPVQH
ncbi:GAF domain-containing protein [Aporhodopirellula aestuarii]|uniref:GAF domain-containing protein n=1 Tax=Aporhodopirellula aestuarii TaxID=2950107 RepID=A0ABT0UAJ2_9BACT|nr:GAF domain-containing protein [Aporhodopirellula aestuarii]MCM2373403.1 GAF domain-containing protein [Aporhodopirellula aestuarii]